jgi:hypothetical protein
MFRGCLPNPRNLEQNDGRHGFLREKRAKFAQFSDLYVYLSPVSKPLFTQGKECWNE